MIGGAVAVQALQSGDGSALESIVQALSDERLSVSERKSYTLAIGQYLTIATGSERAARIAAARKHGIADVLVRQLRLLRGAPEEESAMLERSRHVFNATLAALALAAERGLGAEVVSAGAFDVFVESLSSEKESTLRHAAMGLAVVAEANHGSAAQLAAMPDAVAALESIANKRTADEDAAVAATRALQQASKHSEHGGGGFKGFLGSVKRVASKRPGSSSSTARSGSPPSSLSSFTQAGRTTSVRPSSQKPGSGGLSRPIPAPPEMGAEEGSDKGDGPDASSEPEPEPEPEHARELESAGAAEGQREGAAAAAAGEAAATATHAAADNAAGAGTAADTAGGAAEGEAETEAEAEGGSAAVAAGAAEADDERVAEAASSAPRARAPAVERPAEMSAPAALSAPAAAAAAHAEAGLAAPPATALESPADMAAEAPERPTSREGALLSNAMALTALKAGATDSLGVLAHALEGDELPLPERKSYTLAIGQFLTTATGREAAERVEAARREGIPAVLVRQLQLLRGGAGGEEAMPKRARHVFNGTLAAIALATELGLGAEAASAGAFDVFAEALASAEQSTVRHAAMGLAALAEADGGSAERLAASADSLATLERIAKDRAHDEDAAVAAAHALQLAASRAEQAAAGPGTGLLSSAKKLVSMRPGSSGASSGSRPGSSSFRRSDRPTNFAEAGRALSRGASRKELPRPGSGGLSKPIPTPPGMRSSPEDGSEAGDGADAAVEPEELQGGSEGAPAEAGPSAIMFAPTAAEGLAAPPATALESPAELRGDAEPRPTSREGALLSNAMALTALKAGDVDALGEIVRALDEQDLPLPERKSYTLAIGQFLTTAVGREATARRFATRKAELPAVLARQLRTLRGPAEREAAMLERTRQVFNATLAALAVASERGLAPEVVRSGAYDFFTESLASEYASTVRHAAMGLAALAEADGGSAERLAAAPDVVAILEGLSNSKGSDQDTAIAATRALQSAARHSPEGGGGLRSFLGSFRRISSKKGSSAPSASGSFVKRSVSTGARRTLSGRPRAGGGLDKPIATPPGLGGVGGSDAGGAPASLSEQAGESALSAVPPAPAGSPEVGQSVAGIDSPAPSMPDSERRWESGQGALLTNAMALTALRAGDEEALGVLARELERGADELPLAERKSYTLAIATYVGEGGGRNSRRRSGDIGADRVLAVTNQGVVSALGTQLRTLLGHSAASEPSIGKRMRYITNTSLSALANLAYGGVVAEQREAGILPIVLGCIESSNADTQKYALAVVQNLTNSDPVTIKAVQESPGALEALQRIVDSGEERLDEDTLVIAAGALANASRPTQKRAGLAVWVIGKLAASSPAAIKLARAKARKEAARKKRAQARIASAVVCWRARGTLSLLRQRRAVELGALDVIARHARAWRSTRLRAVEALRKIEPPFAELPTVWELAGEVADGVAIASTQEELEKRRLLVHTVQGALHVLLGEELHDVCAWLRTADGTAVLPLLMCDDDAEINEAASHIVANMVSTESDTPEGVRASREMLLQRRVLHALALRLEPLGGTGDGPNEFDVPASASGGEPGSMYAAAALHNLSAADNLGANAIRASVIEAQLVTLALTGEETSLALAAAGDAQAADAALMAARLALGTLCNLEEWATVPPPEAEELGLTEEQHAWLRARVMRQFFDQIAARILARHAARIIQRAVREMREVWRERRALREVRDDAATVIQRVERGVLGRREAQRRREGIGSMREMWRMTAKVAAARLAGKRKAARLATAPLAQQERADFKRKRHAAIMIQSAERTRLARREAQARRERRVAEAAERARQRAAATRLQAAARGMLARRARAREAVAVELVQRITRGHAARARHDPDALRRQKAEIAAERLIARRFLMLLQRRKYLLHLEFEAEQRARRAHLESAASRIGAAALSAVYQRRYRVAQEYAAESRARTVRARTAALIQRAHRKWASSPHKRNRIRRLAQRKGSKLWSAEQQLLDVAAALMAVKEANDAFEEAKREGERRRSCEARYREAARRALAEHGDEAWSASWAEVPPLERMLERDNAACHVQTVARGRLDRRAVRRRRDRRSGSRATTPMQHAVRAAAASEAPEAADAPAPTPVAAAAEAAAHAATPSADAPAALAGPAPAAVDAGAPAEAAAPAAALAPAALGGGTPSSSLPATPKPRQLSPLAHRPPPRTPEAAWATPVLASSAARRTRVGSSTPVSRARPRSRPSALESLEWPTAIDGGGTRPMQLPELQRASEVLDARERQLARMRIRVDKLGREVDASLTMAAAKHRRNAGEYARLLETQRLQHEQLQAQRSLYSSPSRAAALRMGRLGARSLTPMGAGPMWMGVADDGSPIRMHAHGSAMSAGAAADQPWLQSLYEPDGSPPPRVR